MWRIILLKILCAPFFTLGNILNLKRFSENIFGHAIGRKKTSSPSCQLFRTTVPSFVGFKSIASFGELSGIQLSATHLLTSVYQHVGSSNLFSRNNVEVDCHFFLQRFQNWVDQLGRLRGGVWSIVHLCGRRLCLHERDLVSLRYMYMYVLPF